VINLQTVDEGGMFSAALAAAASLESCNTDTALSQHVPPNQCFYNTYKDETTFFGLIFGQDSFL